MILLLFPLAQAWGHGCSELEIEAVPESSFLMQLFRESRAMSYTSQTGVGRNPQRTVRANPKFLPEAKELTKNELAFIRGRERMFHLNDEEIADFYFVKVVGEIQNQKSRMLAIAARANFRRLLNKEPSRDQVRLLRAALRTINWDFEFIAADDLAAAQRVLEQPLHDFTDVQLKLILAKKATQTELMAVGLEVSPALSIANLFSRPLPAEPTPCCHAFAESRPCAGCGRNVGYHQLEIEREKQSTPVFPVATNDAAVPERLFLYLGENWPL